MTYMTYMIDRIVPDEGFTLHNMIENGDYTISRIGEEYIDLYDAIRALGEAMTNDLNNEVIADYEIRYYKNDMGGVLMGTMSGKLFIE